LGLAGRATVEQHFNRPRLAKELAPLYSRLAREQGAPLPSAMVESEPHNFACP